MKQTTPNHTPLNQEAEAQLVRAPDAKELLQEHQAHQVELAIQNQQLLQLQAVLEESLAHYVDFFEYAPVGYFILNQKGMINEINFTGAALLGVARSKLAHCSLEFFVATEDRQRWQNHFIKVLTCDDKLTCELAFQHDDDPRFDAQLDCQRLIKTDKEPVVRVVLTNITKRKLVEEALRESESRHRLLIENSPVCIHEIDLDGRITSMNRAGLNMMGAEDECAVRGFLYLDAVSDDDRERIGELLARAYAGETSHFEFKASGPQGLIFKSCFVPIMNKEGSVEKLMGITEDITERKRAEEKLQRFFDLVPDLACIASADGHFLKINPAWQAVLGYAEQEILSTPFLDFIHPDDRDATMEGVARQLAGEATLRFTNRYRHKDGSYRWLEWTATSDVDRKLLYASARDITARKQADEQVRRSSGSIQVESP